MKTARPFSPASAAVALSPKKTRIRGVHARTELRSRATPAEPIVGSLRTYPIKNYGAIAIGEHRFCELATQRCVGVAKFTHVWRERGGQWQMTRILSYDHQPLK
jgi:hypothetical protein